MKTKYTVLFSLFFFIGIVSFSQIGDVGAPLVLYGKTITSDGKALDAVNIVVVKDGKQISNQTTDKKGKFRIEDDFVQNTKNKNFIYKVTFSKPNYVTKVLEFNTYMPIEDYTEMPYDFEALVEMFPTKHSSVTINRASGKVAWQSKQNKYDFDAAYAASIAAEEKLLKQNPDKFLEEYEKKQNAVAVDPVEEKYKSAIAIADAAFNTKNYEIAKNSYNDALKAKPSEKYPKDKIAEIDKLLAANSVVKENEIKQKYAAAITKADKALSAKDYSAAKIAYNEATLLKPAELYPKNKLKEIETALVGISATEKLALEKAEKAKYDAAIKRGNTAFTAKKYEDAKVAFAEASSVKPSEPFPKNKIKEIETLLAGTAKNEKAVYDATIARGAAALASKDYEKAKKEYSEAHKLRPTEPLPNTKLKEIETALVAIAKTTNATKTKYDAAIAKANTAFAAKNYDAAKTAYNEALSINPSETLPKNKLKEINEILNVASANEKLKAEKAKYDAAIAKADVAFNTEKYEDARAEYQLALVIMPNEKYPADKIAKANELIEAAKNKNLPVASVEPVFDGAKVFSVSKEKQKMQEEKRKLERRKAYNLHIKYETSNVSTSLLDVVDAYDKKNKH